MARMAVGIPGWIVVFLRPRPHEDACMARPAALDRPSASRASARPRQACARAAMAAEHCTRRTANVEALWQRIRRKLATIGMHATLLCLALCAAVTCHAWPTSQASERPILPELQALFEEAVDTFPIMTLHGMPQPRMRGISWVDNHRVVYTVRKLPDWEARSDERSKIIIYDIDAQTYEETPYRGDLWCLGLGGQILVQDYALPYFFSIQPGDTAEDTRHFLSGTLGQPLTRIERTPEIRQVDPFSCRFYNNADHNFGKGHMLRPLRPGDGVLDEAPGGDIRLVSPEGNTKWVLKIDQSCNFLPGPVYLPWINRYYIRSTWLGGKPGCSHANRNTWLFSADQIRIQIQTLTMPRLLDELQKPVHGLGSQSTIYWAKPGMFFSVRYSIGLNGLYWVDEKAGKLKRVLKQPWDLDQISPNGCRSLINTNPPSLIELCKEQMQWTMRSLQKPKHLAWQ